MLEKWEKAVMRINNNGQVWKANRYSFICSNHFEQQDYIVPPTSTKGTRTCEDCVRSLVGEITPSKVSDHNYCGSSVYSEVSSASAFTLFINNGGLHIPSKSVFTTIEQCEHIFKRYVCQKGNSISNTKNLKSKMILDVCHHFLLESNRSLFTVHEPSSNEDIVDDHRIKLMKWIADKYFTLRLFTYGKHYTETVIQNRMPSARHQMNKLILFKNQ